MTRRVPGVVRNICGSVIYRTIAGQGEIVRRELTNYPQAWDFGPFRRRRLIGQMDVVKRRNLKIQEIP